MWKALPAALFVAPLLALAPEAIADGFSCGDPIDVGGVAYLVVDEVAGKNYLFSFWVFQETNGEPGLQRPRYAVNLLGDGFDPCGNCDSNCDLGFF